MTPELERISSPGYLDAIGERPLPEVRAMRATCQQHENAVSFVRRLIQGRLDIVGGELTRRRHGGDPTDLSQLIGQLPDILSERRGPLGGGTAEVRAPLDLEPDPALVGPLHDRLDAIVEAAHLSDLAQRSDDELASIAEELQEFEVGVSAQRRMLHERIDRLQAEITRRYRDGEASVDALLQ